MDKTKKYYWLDLLRGVSAVLVCANHLRAAMFEDYSSGYMSGIAARFFYFVTGLGAQAVVVFFVLSGFLVGGAVIRRWEEFKFLDYLVGRLIRLWVVLIPVLVLTYFSHYLLIKQLPGLLNGEYFQALSSGPKDLYSVSLAAFVGNVLFLQTICVPVYGVNSPLWSLSNEFWYYMTFPLLMTSLDRSVDFKKRVLTALVVLITYFLISDKLVGLFVWLMGVFACVAPFKKDARRNEIAFIFSLLGFLLAVVFHKLALIPGMPSTLLLGAFTSLLVYQFKLIDGMPKSLQNISQFLSKISYSLYLLHFPIVMLVYSYVYERGQLSLTPLNAGVYLSILLIIVLFSYIFWLVVESKTENIRGLVLARIHGGKIAS